MSDESAEVLIKPPSTPGPVDVTEGPPLGADTIDEFIEWAAAVPTGRADLIRERIASARGDDRTLDSLIAELGDLPVRDVGRRRILLSTLGELGDERAIGPLVRFIWHATLVLPLTEGDGCAFETSSGEALQARAVEMVSYLGTDEAIEETLRIAAHHTSKTVRAAAIDAHLYNNGDTVEEMNRLDSRVRSTDRSLIGLPRFTGRTDRRDFERAVAAYYERNPGYRPPTEPNPNPSPAPAPRDRVDEIEA